MCQFLLNKVLFFGFCNRWSEVSKSVKLPEIELLEGRLEACYGNGTACKIEVKNLRLEVEYEGFVETTCLLHKLFFFVI